MTKEEFIKAVEECISLDRMGRIVIRQDKLVEIYNKISLDKKKD